MSTEFVGKSRSRLRSEPRVQPKAGSDSFSTAPVGVPVFLRRSFGDPTIPGLRQRQGGTEGPERANTHRTRVSMPQPGDASEREADRVAEQALSAGPTSAPETPRPSPEHTGRQVQPLIHGAVPASTQASDEFFPKLGSGKPLGSTVREHMETTLKADFSAVRVHTDGLANDTAQALGANAFTRGNDIYFNQGRYDPESSAGRRLLAHELTHVVQQDGTASQQIQCDLMSTIPTSLRPGALGYFEIEMADRAAPRPGLEGHIRFFPDPAGPYSAQIGLIQVVNVTDMRGVTAPASGSSVNWSHVGTGAEAGRQALMTTGVDGAPPGWFVDAQTATHPPGISTTGPDYMDQWTSPPPDNEFGWLRSPTDVHQASLYDYPWFSFDVDFDFETVAKATDTQTVYGTLHWGFGIRSKVVQNEYARAVDAQSTTFDEALERFRGYYQHEPIVLYFDTDVDTPVAGEEAKIMGVLDYLRRYPDVHLEIDGYADERGNSAHNADLSLRRTLNVQTLVAALGIDPTRIDAAIGWGESHAFAPGPAAGSLRANRRVVISFVRTASTPIRMP